MKRFNLLLMVLFAVVVLAGCGKEENSNQNNEPVPIQLANNQMSVDGQVYDVNVSLAQTGQNFGARTTTIDFAVATGEYSGSINMTAVLENHQIDLVDPLPVVGNNLFDINIMDRTENATSPHFFAYYVSEGEVLGFVGDSEPLQGGCFSSGWTRLSHDSQYMHFEFSGVLKDGRKVEMKLNIPEASVYYF